MMGEVSKEEVYQVFCEQAVALEEGGADALIIETMMALDEATIATTAAKENTSLPVICTFTFEKTINNDYRSMMGVSPTDMVSALIDSGATIVGANCGNGIDRMVEIAKEMRKANPTAYLMIQANAGIPEIINGKSHFRESPVEMGAQLPHLIDQNVNIIGGCCGTTPDHIARFSEIITHANS